MAGVVLVSTALVGGSLSAAASEPAAPAPAPGQEATAEAPSAQRRKDFTFDLATFNVLGSQHTRPGGKWGNDRERSKRTARVIRSKGVDVIGLQEVQDDQYAVLTRELPAYRFWPGPALGNQGMRLQIAWRTQQFALERTGFIMTRFDHQQRPIPWVELRNRNTDRTMFVIDIHNSPKGQEADRDAATREQIALIKELRAEEKPVFVVGDMNEKAEWYCKVTGATDLRAANGGKADARGCVPPRRRLRIDWIMGGRLVKFSRYKERVNKDVRRSSDHEFITTRVKVLPPHRRAD